jgi:hypothetical protein
MLRAAGRTRVRGVERTVVVRVDCDDALRRRELFPSLVKRAH